MSDELITLLDAVAKGRIRPNEAADLVRDVLPPAARDSDLGFAVVDDDRAARIGTPEVVYGAGKTAEQIVDLFEHLVSRGQPALATRVDPATAAVVTERCGATWEPVPRMLSLLPEGWVPPERDGTVAVVTGGTSDLPVAEEAARTAEWLGWRVLRVTDVGVAGLHRLLSRLPVLREADVLIVVAGMEGALPSVVGGLLPQPLVAVPTSVGYGSHLDGLTPLLAMLNSCASGVTVVNIDNGFGAARAAHRILAGKR